MLSTVVMIAFYGLYLDVPCTSMSLLAKKDESRRVDKLSRFAAGTECASSRWKSSVGPSVHQLFPPPNNGLWNPLSLHTRCQAQLHR